MSSIIVQPSARERFTPRELISAYKDFVGGVPQYLDAETGIRATAYRLSAGVLLVLWVIHSVRCSSNVSDGR
jgi:hypothetical protein